MEKELKYIKKVDSFAEESIYIKKCFTAMRTLAKNPHLVKNETDKDASVPERNYILSMVYNMGKTDFLRNDTELLFQSTSELVGGEMCKNIELCGTKERDTSEALHFTNKGRDKGVYEIEVIPDLLIHNSLSRNSPNFADGQFLALEAKTSKRLTQYYFMRDLFKLNLYISALEYQNAVYLVVNKSASEIDEYIGTYKNKYYLCDEVESKLRFFIQENDTPEMYKMK